MFIRLFSTSTRNNGSVKSKLRLLLATNNPKEALTKKEVIQKNQKILRLKRHNRNKPLNSQKFNSIIKNENYKKEDITPQLAQLLNSASDTTTNNLKLLYNYLGTSGFQLQDSYVVEKDALKFLGKDQDMKAILLCKLAKENGVVGMNHVLQYYLDNRMYNNALKLINWRKKWNVPMNEQSFTILFNGFGKSETLLTSNQIEKLHNIYNDMVQKYRNRKNTIEDSFDDSLNGPRVTKLTKIHINSALSCLTNCDDQQYAWEIFKNLTASGPHSADNITMSIMLNGLRHIKDEDIFKEKFKLLLNEAIKSKIDLGNKVDLTLLTSLVNSIARRSTKSKKDPNKYIKEKQKIYSLILNYVDLGRYNFEDFQKVEIYNEKRKLLPNRKLLTSLIKLTTDMPNLNSNDYFFRILERNFKGMDNIFLKEWLIGNSRYYKISNVGENTYSLLQKFLKFLKDNKKDYMKVVSDDNFALLSFTFSCLSSQSFHLNNQYFNAARWKGAYSDNTSSYNILKRKNNYKLFKISNDLKNIIPETSLLNNLQLYHSYLNSIHNLQLDLKDEIKIMLESLKVVNNYQLNFDNSQRISESELLALKGILLNIMKYSKSSIRKFKSQLLSQTDNTFKERESINMQLLSLKKFMSVLIEPVYSLDKLIKKSK